SWLQPAYDKIPENDTAPGKFAGAISTWKRNSAWRSSTVATIRFQFWWATLTVERGVALQAELRGPHGAPGACDWYCRADCGRSRNPRLSPPDARRRKALASRRRV